MKKYWTVAILGWQDSLVYRFNALIWVLYAVLPSVTLMLVWLAAYQSGGHTEISGYNLREMMTYYVCVTALIIAITPHPEWDIAEQIRNGQITQFIVRPISFFSYRLVQETSYQIVKSGMMLPALAIVVWCFRAYLQLPAFDALRYGRFLLAIFLAYGMLSQIKFLLGISAFWIGEPGGFMEIWNVLARLFGGGMLPLALLPSWLRVVSDVLPFSSLYAFPMDLLLARATPEQIATGFTRQIIWLAVLALAVRWTWRRGLRAYEGYGG